jgi:Methylamine utilisation protein MauE
MIAAASTLGVVQSLAVQLAAFLAALLLASGLHKLTARERVRTALHEFAGVPRSLAAFAGMAVAAAEIIAAVLLWMPSRRTAGGVFAALIMGGYLALIARAIARGRRDVDCGCTFGGSQRPLGAYQAVRNTCLTGAALLVAAISAAGAAEPVIAPQILAALALLALYGALDQVMSLTPPRAGELL